jgi:membrane-associated phospholipid phosphatase
MRPSDVLGGFVFAAVMAISAITVLGGPGALARDGVICRFLPER